jgi:hypothetical protein
VARARPLAYVGDGPLGYDAVSLKLWLKIAGTREVARETPRGDAQPDVPTHIKRHPLYLSDAMRAEVPWMYQQPPMWRCLSPGLGHAREHLALIELLKQQLRAK